MYEIVLERGSAAPTRLRGGSVAPETLRNTALYNIFLVYIYRHIRGTMKR
jgi:hypothetical protein